MHGHHDMLSLTFQSFDRKVVKHLGAFQIFAVLWIACWANPRYPSLASVFWFIGGESVWEMSVFYPLSLDKMPRGSSFCQCLGVLWD